MKEILFDALTDSLLDTLKLFVFLLLTYIFIEYFEHRAGEKAEATLYGLGAKGPILGAVAGLLPMCGLSATACDLFANRLISAGTLIAVFAAETDEAFPVMLANKDYTGKAFLMLALSFVIGILAGLPALKLFGGEPSAALAHEQHHHMHEHCEEDECEKHGIFGTALLHALKCCGFVFVALFLLQVIIGAIGEERFAVLFSVGDIFEPLLAVLFALIPNCAPSVILPQFYMSGIISFGAMMGGLTMNAGVGMAILLRHNHNKEENLKILGYLAAVSLVVGYSVQAIGL